MPPTVIGLTQGLNLYVQLTNGTFIRPALTDKIIFSGPIFLDPMLAYNESTHLATSANVHRCTPTHVNNTKYVTGSTVSINGGGTVSLPISKANSTFLVEFFALEEVTVSLAKFYVFSGSDSTQLPSATVYGAEGAVSTNWQDINSVTNAISLTPSGLADTEHDFYVSVSMTPSSPGVQTGTLKMFVTYV